jgi:hypothetical protein
MDTFMNFVMKALLAVAFALASGSIAFAGMGGGPV